MFVSRRTVTIERRTVWGVVGLALLSFGLSAAAGCTKTQFYNEGPGQPDDRASGAVPTGMIGVCRRPFSQRPPIVNPSLWEHAKPCRGDTPRSYIRLGYGHERTATESSRKIERMMNALREGPKEEGGNTTVLGMLRTIRAEGETDPWLRDRVQRESARTNVCDFTYLLNTMESESARLRDGDRCSARAYDQVERQEVCMFNTEVEEAVWLTSAWACVTRTGTIGRQESCHRLCAYDDYCANQVSCAAPDIDLALCALGVCLPQPEGLGL